MPAVRDVRDWFDEALQLTSPEVEALVNRAEQESPTLGAELRELLASHREAGGFLEVPPANPWTQAARSTFRSWVPDRPPLIPAKESLAGFRIKRHLGSGASSHVYLAAEVELEREVAIKVSRRRENQGGEARKMAPLAHDGIVAVYSVKTLPEEDLELICMQYVAGCTLQELIRAIHHPPGGGQVSWSGRTFLQHLDQASTDNEAIAFNPALFREREVLSACSDIEATLHLGMRLCSALSFAHGRGVLHFDVKPANILMTPYGRPVLTDFNTSVQVSQGVALELPAGGTPGYMSPEHFRLLSNPSSTEVLCHKSDLFSLSVVLIELLSGKRPRNAEEASALLKSAPAVVRSVLVTCLNDDPRARSESADELSAHLENALRIHQAQARIGRTRIPGNAVILLMTAMLVPQLIGSLLNISYNSLRIVTQLDERQREAFRSFLLGYNGITYSLGLLWLCWYATPLFHAIWKEGRAFPDEREATRLREIILTLPWLLAIVCTLGWLPGAWLFPHVIDIAAGPIPRSVYLHFIASITLSWMVALNYSFLLSLCICLNRIYPVLWSHHERLAETASRELRKFRRGLGIFVGGCGLIPLLGAVLAIGTDSGQDGGAFRILLVTLIGLGMVGFAFALLMYHSLREQQRALG